MRDTRPAPTPLILPRAIPAVLALLAAGADAPPERLPVSAQLRPSTCYVGQAVDLVVGVEGARERPEVTPPKIEGADVRLSGTDMVPVSISAIGDAVFERNLYRTRFRVVPRKAGTLAIPPVAARLGDRTGASKSLALRVKTPPAEGRPSSFLGGVGAFEVEASAEPANVRVGEAFEYRVNVRGPAALGVRDAPSLDRFAGLPLGLRVDRRPDEAVDDPPRTRSFTGSARRRPARGRCRRSRSPRSTRR